MSTRLRAASRLLVGSTLITAVAIATFVATSQARPVRPAASMPTRATGVTFTQRITSTSADKRSREAASNLTTVRMQDGNVRMDYLEGTTPMGQKGGYIVIQGESGKFLIVSPKDKSVVMMTADGMGSGMGAMMNNPMFKMTISGTSFRFKDLGAGEAMLGYKTRRVRTFYNSTIETKVLMMNNKITVADSTEQWIANVDFDPRNLEVWSKSFSSGVKSTNPELAAELAKYAKEYGRTGLALKTITWSTRTDKNGKVTSDTVTMDVSDLKTGAIDASVFEIPKDYTVTDMTQMAAGISASMDSAKAEDAKNKKAESKKEEKSSNPADAIKAGIGGMFKKKTPPDTVKKPPV